MYKRGGMCISPPYQSGGCAVKFEWILPFDGRAGALCSSLTPLVVDVRGLEWLIC